MENQLQSATGKLRLYKNNHQLQIETGEYNLPPAS